ncbi:hypothetical protein GOBAR_AA23605 [Gossypium barbadense]|uniref:Uncharacterized protein n=1 Tax=Gossypium barbadense TaxID=3634 RepID=A0A2P5X147_GOSBA|nr:hypothetical protein GOBAR_AA23605 [Gossypium barbadense]
MPNAFKFLKELQVNKRKLDERSHVELNAICSAILLNKEISSKDTHEPCSNHNKESTHEERRLRIGELDEWLTFKSKKHDKPKLRQNELNASPNQLKVGHKVSLDAADPHIDTAKLNEEIPLTVLSIFPFGTVEVSHPNFGTFKAELRAHGRAPRLTYRLMNLYDHRSILLHSHADYPPKLEFKECIHHSGSFTSLPIL